MNSVDGRKCSPHSDTHPHTLTGSPAPASSRIQKLPRRTSSFAETSTKPTRDRQGGPVQQNLCRGSHRSQERSCTERRQRLSALVRAHPSQGQHPAVQGGHCQWSAVSATAESFKGRFESRSSIFRFFLWVEGVAVFEPRACGRASPGCRGAQHRDCHWPGPGHWHVVILNNILILP